MSKNKQQEKSSKVNKKLTKPEVFDYAVYLLSLSLQSTDKLREKLLRKGYIKTEIDQAIGRLTELKYLNDDQFAQIYFDNMKKYKSFGYFGVKKKLMDKKVPKKIIDHLLSKFTLKQEQEIAERVMDSSRAKNKTWEQRMRMLQSRGFRPEVVVKASKIH